MNSNKEYAKALFLIAAEHEKIDEYYLKLCEIRELLKENPQYTEFISSPALPLSERLDAIEKAFTDYGEHIIAFMKLICEKGLFAKFPDCIEEFSELKRISENSITAHIYSAIPLNNTQKDALIAKLSKKYGKQIVAVYTVDKALLGGIKVEIDGKTLDGTAQKNLNLVKGAMNG